MAKRSLLSRCPSYSSSLGRSDGLSFLVNWIHKRLLNSVCLYSAYRYSDSLRTGRSGDQILMGRHFPHPSRSTVGPTLPSIEWVLCPLPGGKAVGVWRWPPIPSSAEVKERVELYLILLLEIRDLLQGDVYLYLDILPISSVHICLFLTGNTCQCNYHSLFHPREYTLSYI